MKTQIEKLVKIAERYADFARAVHAPKDKHVYFRGGTYNELPPMCENGGRISVYLVFDRDGWFQVDFDNISIVVFGEPKINMLCSETEESLESVCRDVTSYFDVFLSNKAKELFDHYEGTSRKYIEEKIKRLKEELERYENI